MDVAENIQWNSVAWRDSDVVEGEVATGVEVVSTFVLCLY